MQKVNKTDSIFIAGQSGMVGSAISRKLKDNGYQNLLTPSRNTLDLLHYKSTENWFKKYHPDVVILAAAKVGGIDANFKFSGDFILENLKIQTNVIDNAWKYNIKKFIFLGSSCIYPKFAQQPIKEEFLLTSPLELTNESYAIAKIAGIKLCAALKKQYDFEAISLMPTNLYGPGDNYHPTNSHVLPSLIRKFFIAKNEDLPSVTCWGTGAPKREFLYVEDLADALLFVLENVSSDNKLLYDQKNNYQGIINIGTGKDITIKDLVNTISELFEYEGKIVWDQSKPDGTPRKLLDVSKINDLGWQASTKLKDGIISTIDHFKSEFINKKVRD